MSERLFLRLDDDPLHGPEANVPAGTLRAWPVSAPLIRHVAHALLCREFVPAREHGFADIDGRQVEAFEIEAVGFYERIGMARTNDAFSHRREQ